MLLNISFSFFCISCTGFSSFLVHDLMNCLLNIESIHGMYMLIVNVTIAYIVYYMIFCRCKPKPVSNHQDGKPSITKWRSHLLTVTR